MRAEVRANVEREVKKRVEARVKEQALQALLAADAARAARSRWCEMEAQQHGGARRRRPQGARHRSAAGAAQSAGVRGGARSAASRSGLIIAELARAENLQPKPAEVRALVEQEAQSYESPAEVVKWFYMQPQRLSEMEALALETNVVKWVLTKAKVLDKPVSFDELMGASS